MCVHAKSLKSCPTHCDPMDCSLPGSSVHGILWTKILSGLPCPPSGDLHDSGIESMSQIHALASMKHSCRDNNNII